MACYSWELAQTIRAALDEVMTKIPADQATSAVKAKVAVNIFQAAAKGQTSYQSLMRAALDQIDTNNFRTDLKTKSCKPSSERYTIGYGTARHGQKC
jgi:N-acetylglucosamine kinase-like BadF-type ATPase